MRNNALSRVLPVALFAALLAAPASAGDLAEAIDGEALAYLGIPSVPALAAPGESAFDGIMAEEEVVRFLAEGFPALAALQKEFARAAGLTFSEAADLASGQAALAVLPDGENVVAAVAAVEVDPESEKLDELLRKLESLAEWQTFNIPGGRLHSTALGRVEAAWGLFEGYLVFGTSQKALADLCGALAAGRPDSLAGKARYRKCLEMADAARSELAIYIDAEAVAETCLGRALPEVRPFMDEMGILDVGAVFFASRPAADGFLDTLLLYFPRGRSGIFAAPEPAAKGAEGALGRIPRDVISAGWSHGDLGVVYDAVAAALQAGVPSDILAAPAGLLDDFEAESGVDVRGDLVGSLGKDILSYAPSPSQVLGLGFSGGFGGVTMVELADPERFAAALEDSWAWLKANQERFTMEFESGPFASQPVRFVFLEQDIAGNRVYQARVALTPMMQLSPSMAVADGRVIFAMDAQGVRNALSAPGADEAGLPENPDFARAAGLAGTADTEISYLDAKTTFENSYSVIAMMLPLLLSQVDAEMPVDQLLLPAGPSISRHLFGSATAVTAGDDHLKITTFGPVGRVRAAFSGGAAGAALGHWMGRARAASRAPATQAQAAPEAPAAEARADGRVLKEAALALLMYSDAHEGEFPADFAALVEAGYLKGEAAEKIVRFRYVPGLRDDDPSSLIIAFARDAEAAGRLVLFIDGHVMNLTEAETAEQAGGWLDLPAEPSADDLRAACEKNAKVLAESILRYARHHDGAVPEKLDVAADYRFAPLVTNCPRDAEIGESDYATVAGLDTSEVPADAEGSVLIVYETTGRHDGRHSAVFMDGEYALLTGEELAAAIAETLAAPKDGG